MSRELIGIMALESSDFAIITKDKVYEIVEFIEGFVVVFNDYGDRIEIPHGSDLFEYVYKDFEGKKINKTTLRVDEIRSYQTLVFKNGHRSFPKPIYDWYKSQMVHDMAKLTPIADGLPIALKLTFNLKDGISPPEYRVKLSATGNTSYKCETHEEAIEKKQDKHYIEITDPVVKYGSIGDVDNISKPIVDFLEEMQIISNDRFVVDLHVKKTFGNDNNTIDIEIGEYSGT